MSGSDFRHGHEGLEAWESEIHVRGRPRKRSLGIFSTALPAPRSGRHLWLCSISFPQPVEKIIVAAGRDVGLAYVSGWGASLSQSRAQGELEALASDRADQSFSITVLPWRSWRCRSVANADRAETTRKCLAVDAVVITNEVVRHRLPPAGLDDLPSDPFGGWRCCDANPKNSSAVVSKN